MGGGGQRGGAIVLAGLCALDECSLIPTSPWLRHKRGPSVKPDNPAQKKQKEKRKSKRWHRGPPAYRVTPRGGERRATWRKRRDTCFSDRNARHTSTRRVLKSHFINGRVGMSGKGPGSRNRRDGNLRGILQAQQGRRLRRS